MQTAMFFYNLAVTIGYSVCAIGFFLVYLRVRRSAELWAAVLFSLFIADNLALYMNEFLPGFDGYYTQELAAAPYSLHLIGMGLIFSYRMILLSGEKRKITEGELFFWGAVLVVDFMAVDFLPPETAQWCSFVVMHGLSMLVFAAALFSPVGRRQPPAYKAVLLSSFCLMAAETAEDLANRLGADTAVGGRLITTEVIGLYYVAVGAVILMKVFLADGEKIKRGVCARESEARKLDAFAQASGLTERERQVLLLLYIGKSNQEIGETLFLAPGTVKTHVHNIYQKGGVKNRLELSAAIQKSTEQSAVP